MRKRSTDAVGVDLQYKLLVSVEEAAGLLCLGRSSVYDLVKRNEIYSFKVGRVRRIPVESLRRYIALQLGGL